MRPDYAREADARFRINHPDRRKADRDKRRLENRALAQAYKAEHGCVDCGEDNPIVLDFDHRDPKDKSANVSYLMHARLSWSIILQEIKKCDVRCSNCHRKRTYNQKMAGEIE